MQAELMGLVFDTPAVVVRLWSPWRASAIEHRLFDQIRQIASGTVEEKPDELVLKIHETKEWNLAVGVCNRVMMGWEEEADHGTERRLWCWVLEGDVNMAGYDHFGEPASIWALVRVTLERPAIDPALPPVEHFDLENFGVEFQGRHGKKKVGKVT
ncbi:MAG: hypothetical protein EXR99_13450 [Gemmataceae bacterium]|nr:hypothetical protein [Gemmataceae bacterium]